MSDFVFNDCKSIWTQINYCFDGRNKAYVYLFISKKFRIVYVGQTNDRNGTFGRASNHIEDNGTLRQHFEDKFGLKLEEANDLVLISYLLPQTQEYIGAESSYREAVEYLVQKKLRDIRGSLEPRFDLISRVRYSDRVSSIKLQQFTDKIIENFIHNYQ